MYSIDDLRYSIFDPGGNITLLVESNVDVGSRIEAAEKMMQRHPGVEQVGFVRFPDTAANSLYDTQAALLGKIPMLEMAGGEFCGNASMCAALLYYLRSSENNDYKHGSAAQFMKLMENPLATVMLRVSGTSDPVTVKLWNKEDGSYRTSISMPAPKEIVETEFASEKTLLPVVKMEGIYHIIVEQGLLFSQMLNEKAFAEVLVKKWCKELGADGLGILFLEGEGRYRNLIPLVYIPGSNTCFWENSCASGSCAAGVYLASKYGLKGAFVFSEPGGTIEVECDPVLNTTLLYNNIKIVSLNSYRDS